MVLCPGFQKNGRPCTNILEQKNKFCKLCGWKIDPEIFSKEAISCPNIVLSSEEKCGTWIERDQMFCDQCGWEVNHDFFPSRNGTGTVGPECSSGLQAQIKKLSFKQETKLHQNSFLDSLVTPGDTDEDDLMTFQKSASISPHSASSASSLPESGREAKGRILFIHNLNEESITTEKLFNLFSLYGRVDIIKLFFKKKNSGLVQMDTEEHAASALGHLDRVVVQNKTLHIQYSRVKSINTDENFKMTADYRKSKLHRGGVTFNYVMTACAPSAVIHMSHLPESIKREDIIDVFSEYGNVLELKIFKSRGCQGALLKFASVEQAVTAIMEMHNFKFPDNTRLMVSFSHHKCLITEG